MKVSGKHDDGDKSKPSMCILINVQESDTNSAFVYYIATILILWYNTAKIIIK